MSATTHPLCKKPVSRRLSQADLKFAQLARKTVGASKVDECMRAMHDSDVSNLKEQLLDKGYLDQATADDLDAALAEAPLPAPNSERLPPLKVDNLCSIIGETLGGIYLHRVLGKGGSGVVFAGRNADGEVRAIKVLHPRAARNLITCRRFGRESNALARLLHKNIVRVYASGVDRGLHYTTLEYCPGASLSTVVQTHGPLGLIAAIKVALEVTRGLKIAHSKDIIHRDIKPQNILICSDGQVKLADFGLAQIHGTQHLFTKKTVVGTAHYMSPEQSRAETVDDRADIYSMGVVLFYMLTGRWPFESKKKVDLVRQHRDELAPSPRIYRADLPDYVEELVARCLAKDPDERFDGADALIEALKEARAKALLQKLRVYAEETDHGEPCQMPPKRRRRPRVAKMNRSQAFWLAVCGSVFVSTFAIVFLLFSSLL